MPDCVRSSENRHFAAVEPVIDTMPLLTVTGTPFNVREPFASFDSR